MIVLLGVSILLLPLLALVLAVSINITVGNTLKLKTRKNHKYYKYFNTIPLISYNDLIFWDINKKYIFYWIKLIKNKLPIERDINPNFLFLSFESKLFWDLLSIISNLFPKINNYTS